MKTKLEIIEETANFYNTSNRGKSPNKIRCSYLTPEGNKCAVGRCMTDEALKLFQYFDGSASNLDLHLKENTGLQFNDIFLPEYKGHDFIFWNKLQMIHDRVWCWDENGLSECGKRGIEQLKNEYKDL